MPAGKAKRALQVAQAIVSDIQLNAREAGDRLPQEEDMLARYEVARATLREALSAAVDALHDSEARPWIVTEEGDILSPHWIRANRDVARRH